MNKIIFLAILWAVLSSGSVFGAVYTKKSFEKFLPFTFTGIVALLFIFGLFGILLAGVYAVLALALLLWLLAALRLFAMFKNRGSELKSALARLLSPGALVFVFLCLLFLYIDYGRLCRGFDSFSHWAPSVKAMCFLDDFNTNPLARSWYPSYPPGIALMQYFFEKLYVLTGGSFLIWLLYYAYQLFFAAFLLPFFSWEDDKGLLPEFIRIGVLLLVICYAPSYTAIEVDQIMGIVLGAGLAAVFLSRERDMYCCAFVCCASFMLVLFKAAGMLLAAFVAAAFIFALVKDGISIKEKLAKSSAALLALLLPFLLWLYERKSSGVTQSFSSKEFDLDPALFGRLLLGTESSYKQQALDTCISTLFDLRTYGALLEMNLMLLLLIVFVGIFFLSRRFRSRSAELPAGRKFMAPLLLVQFAVYTIGTIFTIVLGFTEAEALMAASLERYLYTFVLALVIVFILLLLNAPDLRARFRYIPALILLLCMVPYMYVADVATRSSVRLSQEEHFQFEQTLANINGICAPWSEVYVVAQGRYTPNWLNLRLGMYPCLIAEIYTWEELWETPATEGIEPLSPEEWMAKLSADYDYVSLFKVDDHFIEKYGRLFAPDSPIEESAVYIVDRDAGLLVKQS